MQFFVVRVVVPGLEFDLARELDVPGVPRERIVGGHRIGRSACAAVRDRDEDDQVSLRGCRAGIRVWLEPCSRS